MPRERWFRELFVARPGHRLVIVDYSAIELVTLAAVLENRYGHSVLADVLREGRDPHAYTASLVSGIPYDEIKRGVKEEKQAGVTGRYTKARQAAKAINFGVPGGLGARKLALYARANYGVDMTEEEARTLRNGLTTKVYPELADYLADRADVRLARNLRTTPEAVQRQFNTRGRDQFGIGYAVEKIVGGRAVRVDGTSYSPAFKQAAWNGLLALNKNPALDAPLRNWEKGDKLRRLLFGDSVATLTGRVRAGVEYCEARNTPFQGLAADGAKLALWELHRRGYRLVAFVHDEIVVEAAEQEAGWVFEEVSAVMVAQMESVLDCDLPVTVEGAVSQTWTK
jgi:DNA polymerase I-like protein with 3'-5' exonuclease and polymerase domains